MQHSHQAHLASNVTSDLTDLMKKKNTAAVHDFNQVNFNGNFAPHVSDDSQSTNQSTNHQAHIVHQAFNSWDAEQLTIDPNKKLNISITVGMELGQAPSAWSSGAWQNVIFLYYLLRNSERVASVKLVNYAVNPAPFLEVAQGAKIPLYMQADVEASTDVLLVMGIQIGNAVEVYRQNGAKVVTFHVGNHYIISLENMLFDLNRGGGEIEDCVVDATWTLPHHYNTCRDFFAVTNHAPCLQVPYLWNPLFIQDNIQKNQLSEKYRYQGHDKPQKNIVIFEPNMNVVKSSLYPLLIAELAYQQQPNCIKNIHVTNTLKLSAQKGFNQFANTLSITHQSVASYDDRYDTPSFMSYYGDVVLSHQWENGLNNVYFDVLYARYPLVHNSPFLKQVGYYYEGFDARHGAQQLLNALNAHDVSVYEQHCAAALYAVDIDNPTNIKAYEDALFVLFAKDFAARFSVHAPVDKKSQILSTLPLPTADLKASNHVDELMS